MKKILLLLFISSFSFAQISVSSKHVGKNASKIKTKDLERFKNSTTLFILSTKFSKEEYDRILKDVWTFTEYEILDDPNNLDREKYYNGNYSFAELRNIQGAIKSGAFIPNLGESFNKKNTYKYCIEFYLVDSKKILKKINKLKSKKNEQDDDYIIDLLGAYRSYNTSIGRIYFDPKGNNQKSDLKNSKGFHFGSGEKKFRTLRHQNIINEFEFENYKLGYLKNYFQLINNKLSSSELFGLYEDKTNIELSNLSIEKLYFPDYIEKIKDYDFEIEQLTTKGLNTKILKGEEFYYAMKTRVRSVGDFTYIVNSKTGACIYYDATAMLGLSNIFDMKKKLIIDGDDFSKAIKKAKKKLDKANKKKK